MSLVHLFFSTQGRVKRGTYWALFGIWFLIDVVLRAGLYGIARWNGNEQLVAVFFWAWIGFSVTTYFPMAALLVKRLHDTGRTGNWLAFQHGFMAALLLFVTAAARRLPGSMMVWGATIFICGIGMLVVFVFSLLAGDDSSNEYGRS